MERQTNNVIIIFSMVVLCAVWALLCDTHGQRFHVAKFNLQDCACECVDYLQNCPDECDGYDSYTQIVQTRECRGACEPDQHKRTIFCTAVSAKTC